MADDNVETPGEVVEVEETTAPDITALENALATMAADKAALDIQITGLLAENLSLSEQLSAARAANLALLTSGSTAPVAETVIDPEPDVESSGIDSLFEESN